MLRSSAVIENKDESFFGASPERLLSVRQGKIIADALAGTAIDLSASTAPVNGWTDKSVLRKPDVAENENKQIDVGQVHPKGTS